MDTQVWQFGEWIVKKRRSFGVAVATEIVTMSIRLPELVNYDVIAAMCHGNRGIGLQLHLPWPYLPNDVAFYKGKSRTFKNKDSRIGENFIIHICGRKTWEGNSDREIPNVRYVIVSSTMSITSPFILKIVPSFEAALEYSSDLCNHGNADSIWVMGGSRIYEAAINHPRCHILYVTHIYQDFPADAFFPRFEDQFAEIHGDNLPKKTQHEENGVTYEFKAYKRICYT